MAKNNTQRASALLTSVTADLLNGELSQQLQDNSLRVERLLLEMVRPDPVQPRRVLPEQIHFAFHDNRLTPTQALRELVQLAQVAARQCGRPFSEVLELLPDSEAESDEEEVRSALSPEEKLLRDLVVLAQTIRDDGQVNPLTVVDVSQGVTRLCRIETGERRYWATWLLKDFFSTGGSDGTMPCIVIPQNRASVFRQAKENSARTGLSAIAMARQAALLLLSVHGYEIPSQSVTNDFYRQALELDLRGKREYTEAILTAMGGITKFHFSHYKSLLRLSDDAIELADRHGIDEKKLRYIIPLPQEAHAEVIRQIIDFNLTAAQVKQLCEQSEDEGEEGPNHTIPRAALHIARLARNNDANFAQNLALALLKQEQDAAVARARLDSIRRLLDDTEQFLYEERKG